MFYPNANNECMGTILNQFHSESRSSVLPRRVRTCLKEKVLFVDNSTLQYRSYFFVKTLSTNSQELTFFL
jgi:hypothetical protein